MKIEDFFRENKKVALGFSGGADSSYLLYVALNCHIDVKPYYVKTQFQPEFEFRDAMRLADEIGVKVTVIEHDILIYEDIKCNSENRCYYCKRRIFDIIKKRAYNDGYTCIIDGTNASDSFDDRPGMKALCELNVKSPLRECGLDKEKIRELSKKAGLFTWNKNAYACLATRISINNEITSDKLFKIEKSEDILMEMGFSDLRIRMYYNIAKLQFNDNEIVRAFELRKEICDKLKPYFDDIVIDLKGRR